MAAPAQRIAQALGEPVHGLAPLSGGCVGEVYRGTLASGPEVVVKVAQGEAATLDIEGYMLGYLAAHSPLPVPAVHHASKELLVMDRVPGASQFNGKAEEHAAELLAACHAVSTAQGYGLDRDTLIGGLHQPNPWTSDWLTFFREQRLVYMAEEAARSGRLPQPVRRRIDALADKLDDLLSAPAQSALLHGVVWTTNVLASGGRITAFLDPAVYYGHPEIELAFITLFHTFGDTFFDAYHARRPIAEGFFDTRRDLYNLYPLLVHVRLFGGGYVSGVERVLQRHGC